MILSLSFENRNILPLFAGKFWKYNMRSLVSYVEYPKRFLISQRGIIMVKFILLESASLF